MMTQASLEQLKLRPNLDLKSSIYGLERTLDMMCEVTERCPSAFLQAYQPLRLPQNARKVFDKSISTPKRPEKLA